MPIYVYQCGDCLGEWKENHLMSESIEECPWCSSGNIGRKHSEFSYGSAAKQKKKKTGDLTKEFIQNSKEDLKNQIKELDNSR